MHMYLNKVLLLIIFILAFRSKFLHNFVIPMVVFGIPRLVHPFNPEYQPTFCLKILNPNLQIRGGGGGEGESYRAPSK